MWVRECYPNDPNCYHFPCTKQNSRKKEMYTYGVNDENRCPYCKEPDSILHTYVECHYTQTFYFKVVDWFNAKFNCAFSPTSHEKLFRIDLNTSRNNELKFNYCFLFAK